MERERESSERSAGDDKKEGLTTVKGRCRETTVPSVSKREFEDNPALAVGRKAGRPNRPKNSREPIGLANWCAGQLFRDELSEGQSLK